MMKNLQQMYNVMPYTIMPRQLELAEAYIPYQQYSKSYSPQESLERGTMFPELDKPYEVKFMKGEASYE